MSSKSECVVREMRREDVPAVASLVAEFAQYMRGLGDATEFRLDAAALERDGFGPRPAFQGLAADIADSLVGYMLYHDGYDTDAACRLIFVVDLFVRQDVRGQGVGVALMREASRIARERGAKHLVWTVDKRNTAAQEFYQRIGGRVVDGLRLMCLDA